MGYKKAFYSSSKIEGELLDRESLQSSILKEFGLKDFQDEVAEKRVSKKEELAGELIVLNYKTFDQKLTKKMLFSFHKLLFPGESDFKVGEFRSSDEAMQIVSSRLDAKRKVYFQAVPGPKIELEMANYIKWFNDKSKILSPVSRAGLAHVYFEAIHPFEDGNGRIGRLLSEKALASSLAQPTLIALCSAMEKNRGDYYKALASTNYNIDITEWMEWFFNTVIQAQENTKEKISLLVKKANFFKTYSGEINPRQEKVLLRIFKEGPEGFKGGLSADNYMKIAKTSASSATRDLQDLVKKKALVKKGQKKYSRYYLNLD